MRNQIEVAKNSDFTNVFAFSLFSLISQNSATDIFKVYMRMFNTIVTKAIMLEKNQNLLLYFLFPLPLNTVTGQGLTRLTSIPLGINQFQQSSKPKGIVSDHTSFIYKPSAAVVISNESSMHVDDEFL